MREIKRKEEREKLEKKKERERERREIEEEIEKKRVEMVSHRFSFSSVRAAINDTRRGRRAGFTMKVEKKVREREKESDF